MESLPSVRCLFGFWTSTSLLLRDKVIQESFNRTYDSGHCTFSDAKRHRTLPSRESGFLRKIVIWKVLPLWLRYSWMKQSNECKMRMTLNQPLMILKSQRQCIPERTVFSIKTLILFVSTSGKLRPNTGFKRKYCRVYTTCQGVQSWFYIIFIRLHFSTLVCLVSYLRILPIPISWMICLWSFAVVSAAVIWSMFLLLMIVLWCCTRVVLFVFHHFIFLRLRFDPSWQFVETRFRRFNGMCFLRTTS